jgi:hypothetical protein
MARLPEIGEIEPAGASADHGDAQRFLPIDSMLTIGTETSRGRIGAP